jgi:hypothetical protein
MTIENIGDFYNRHVGETALLVGNGPNLSKTPPEWFCYPSFGMNTIHFYKGDWKPTYYVAVDYCIYDEFGDSITKAFPDVPKFVPSPVADKWQGDNFYRFPKKTGDIKIPPNREDLKYGMYFYNVMHAAIQIAWYMGFKTLLLIGVEQKPGRGELTKHFWGVDINTPESQNDMHWNTGYSLLVRALSNIKILNISQDTYVPEMVLPRDNWQDWKNN